MHACKHILLHMRAHTHTYTNTHTHTHTHSHTHTRTRTHTHIHTLTHTHAHTYIHTQTCTHIYTRAYTNERARKTHPHMYTLAHCDTPTCSHIFTHSDILAADISQNQWGHVFTLVSLQYEFSWFYKSTSDDVHNQTPVNVQTYTIFFVAIGTACVVMSCGELRSTRLRTRNTSGADFVQRKGVACWRMIWDRKRIGCGGDRRERLRDFNRYGDR